MGIISKIPTKRKSTSPNPTFRALSPFSFCAKRLDLLKGVEALADETHGEDTEIVRLSSSPEYVLSEVRSQLYKHGRPQTGHSFTFLIISGIKELRREPEIIDWCSAWEETQSLPLGLRMKITSWAGDAIRPRLKFIPDCPFGMEVTKDYVFRCPKKKKGIICGLAEELTLPISTVCVVALSKSLSLLDEIDPEAEGPLESTYNNFVKLIGERAKDLRERIERGRATG
jgi:hypothetical protein